MKKFLVALVALGLSVGAADAADLSLKDAPGIITVNNTSWSGFYLGGGLGFEANGAALSDDNAQKISFDGATLTGRAGYDRQFGGLVLGVFGDIVWTDAGKTLNKSAKIDPTFAYALGGRAGLAVGSGLIYVNGGWEWRKFSDIDAKSYNPDGAFLGLGFSHKLPFGFEASLEGRYSWLSGDFGAVKTDNNDASVRVLFTRRF